MVSMIPDAAPFYAIHAANAHPMFVVDAVKWLAEVPPHIPPPSIWPISVRQGPLHLSEDTMKKLFTSKARDLSVFCSAVPCIVFMSAYWFAVRVLFVFR